MLKLACWWLLICRSFLVFTTGASAEKNNLERIEELVVKWAPFIWLAPQEKFLPLGVDEFLKNVYVTDGPSSLQHVDSVHNQSRTFSLPTGPQSEQLYLVTNENLDSLLEDKFSYIYGKRPDTHIVPSYPIVTGCSPHYSFYSSDFNNLKNDLTIIYSKSEHNPYFHVTYWHFYPYNEGKDVCVIGKVPVPLIFNSCLGRRRKLGNHVGDWEHMSLYFRGKPYPSEMYVAVHDAGVYYQYEPSSNLFKYRNQVTRRGIIQRPKFPPVVTMSGSHPVLFSAYGSHGLWGAPGEHYYVRVPRLSDKNGYGIPWETWKALKIIHNGNSILPKWLKYKGKWGNPKSKCFIANKLGLCELSDGPRGILDKKPNFSCVGKH